MFLGFWLKFENGVSLAIVLPIALLIQQVGYFPSLRAGYKGKIWLIIPSPCSFSLELTTLLYYSTTFTFVCKQ